MNQTKSTVVFHVAQNPKSEYPTLKQILKMEELIKNGWKFDKELTTSFCATVMVKTGNPTWILDLEGGIAEFESIDKWLNGK